MELLKRYVSIPASAFLTCQEVSHFS